MPPLPSEEHCANQEPCSSRAPSQKQEQNDNDHTTRNPSVNEYTARNIRDPFEYAPPKEEGDPWAILLEPLMKTDKVRCDSWKAEVENLLIFAGLFSAIVTAFIIESYKKLQQDPNDVIISVLSRIATRLDDSLNSTESTLSSPLIPQFSPPTSSIRINVFWFISLVLSLSTVLIGIISLGWLREHQSYPSSSPRLNYAIFNMRAEALERWYVHRIFTALPLLLQIALILFFVGLIDFLHSLQNLPVLTVVSTIIGFALLFLVFTTLLPTVQGLFLLIGSSNPSPPSPCPYKSPQSRAIHALCRSTYIPAHRCYTAFRSFVHRVRQTINQYVRPDAVTPPLKEDRFTDYVPFLRLHNTWFAHDTTWLQIRDAYMRRFHDRPFPSRRLGHEKYQTFPLFDVVQGLCAQGSVDNSTTSVSLYYAFDEVVEWTLSTLLSQRCYCFNEEKCYHFRDNVYLHDLLFTRQHEPDLSLAEFCVFEPIFHDDGHSANSKKEVHSTLKHQSMFTFLTLTARGSWKSWTHIHRAEISLRLLGHLHQNKYAICPRENASGSPLCLNLGILNVYDLPVTDSEALNNILRQIALSALSLFNKINENHFGNVHIEVSYLPPDLCGSMTELALFTTSGFFSDGQLVAPDESTRDAFNSVIIFLTELLDAEITSRLTVQGTGPTMIFYVAALYTHLIRTQSETRGYVSERLDYLVSVLHYTVSIYKSLTIDQGKTDHSIERQFLASRNSYYLVFEIPPFSEQWWRDYFRPNYYKPPGQS